MQFLLIEIYFKNKNYKFPSLFNLFSENFFLPKLVKLKQVEKFWRFWKSVANLDRRGILAFCMINLGKFWTHLKCFLSNQT